MEYKMVRLMSYFGAAVLPILIAIIAGIATFLMVGNDLVSVALYTVAFTILGVIVVGFGAFQLTGQNAWIKAIQGEAILVFGYSSAGVGQIFTCVTQNNPSGGIDIITKINDKDVVLAYDKPMSYRMLAPATALLNIIRPKKKTNEDGSTGIEKAKTVITIENEDFDKYAMKFGYLTVLFFNYETGTLTNKFNLNELEKFYAMKYLSLHLDRKLDIYIAELRMARKNFFDSLLSKLTSFLKSPMFPVLVIAIVGFFAVVIIMNMFPQIGSFIGGILPHSVTPVADTNTIIAPITHGSGAITPIK